jgi:hypothetical protein
MKRPERHGQRSPLPRRRLDLLEKNSLCLRIGSKEKCPRLGDREQRKRERHLSPNKMAALCVGQCGKEALSRNEIEGGFPALALRNYNVSGTVLGSEHGQVQAGGRATLTSR